MLKLIQTIFSLWLFVSLSLLAQPNIRQAYRSVWGQHPVAHIENAKIMANILTATTSQSDPKAVFYTFWNAKSTQNLLKKGCLHPWALSIESYLSTPLPQMLQYDPCMLHAALLKLMYVLTFAAEQVAKNNHITPPHMKSLEAFHQHLLFQHQLEFFNTMLVLRVMVNNTAISPHFTAAPDMFFTISDWFNNMGQGLFRLIVPIAPAPLDTLEAHNGVYSGAYKLLASHDITGHAGRIVEAEIVGSSQMQGEQSSQVTLARVCHRIITHPQLSLSPMLFKGALHSWPLHILLPALCFHISHEAPIMLPILWHENASDQAVFDLFFKEHGRNTCLQHASPALVAEDFHEKILLEYAQPIMKKHAISRMASNQRVLQEWSVSAPDNHVGWSVVARVLYAISRHTNNSLQSILEKHQWPQIMPPQQICLGLNTKIDFLTCAYDEVTGTLYIIIPSKKSLETFDTVLLCESLKTMLKEITQIARHGSILKPISSFRKQHFHKFIIHMGDYLRHHFNVTNPHD